LQLTDVFFSSLFSI